ncbi:MerR family transcriptional regulator [Streptomyces sp. NPDC007088]|uniref:MerR family transcriptional regulator n=1 Tax=Streptomyces sp. NPDC007088 TaxID=3364773 RepID=UPI0036B6D898
MRIGQLSERTGASPRLLRYYEEQELIGSRRSPNGYREFDEACVDKVLQVRALIDIGLPTRVIRRVLPCLDRPRDIHFSDATPETLATLERERDRMAERIRCLVRNRDAITAYLEAVRLAGRGTPHAPQGGERVDGAGVGRPDESDGARVG